MEQHKLAHRRGTANLSRVDELWVAVSWWNFWGILEWIWGPGCRRSPCSILYRTGLGCWALSLVPPPGKAKGYCGCSENEQVSPGRTRTWAEGPARPGAWWYRSVQCLGSSVGWLCLVSGGAAGSGAGVLGCQMGTGTLLWRQVSLRRVWQGSVPGATQTGGLPVLSQCHSTSEHSQRPVSENFSAFSLRQLAWHIFRWCCLCSFQKVEMEKKKSCK